MQLGRQLRPNAHGRVRGGYLTRRRPQPPALSGRSTVAERCSFCGIISGPFTTVQGHFTC